MYFVQVSDYPVTNTEVTLTLTDCALASGLTFYLVVYVEGPLGASGNSLADGYVYKPVAFTVAADDLLQGSSTLVSSVVDSLSFTDTSVVSGYMYSYNVRGVNSVGAGYPSETSDFLVASGPPAAPGQPIATSRSSTSVFLQWAPPDNGGSLITGFVLEMRVSTSVNWSVIFTGSDTSYTKLGLTAGLTYLFRVRALNVAGVGAWSSALLVITCATPTIPLNLVVATRLGENNIYTRNEWEDENYTPNEWRRCKTTLETSGEDAGPPRL